MRLPAPLVPQTRLPQPPDQHKHSQTQRTCGSRAGRGVNLRDPTSSSAPHAVADGGEAAVAWARTQFGVPYVYGGAGPDGYDCSGLTMRAWEVAGVSLPRTSREHYTATTRITRSAARPGDLVFWSADGTPTGIYYVAILSRLDAAGGARVIQAPSPGRSVEEVDLRSEELLGYGRVTL
ncbi:C40 family peptidase [Salana multivorans]